MMSDKLSLEDDAFQLLEKDFHEVILELMGDKTLQRFRLEYERLHKALKKAHESEKRLMNKCRDLNAEIVSNSIKVSQALKLSQDDQATIQQLKQELERAWKTVDAATERESHARETIATLKLEIVNLTNLVKLGAGETSEPDFSAIQMTKAKEELIKERDQLLEKIVTLRAKLTEVSEDHIQNQTKLEEAEMTIVELQQSIQTKQNEIRRETRRKERLEDDYTNGKKNLKEKEEQIKALQTQLQKSKDDNAKLESQLKDQRILYDRSGKDIYLLNTRLTKLQQDYQTQIETANSLASDNKNKAADLKAAEDEIHEMRHETVKQTRLQESIQKRLQAVEEEKAETESQKDALRVQISGLEREIESLKKQAEMDKKVADDLTREREILNKNYHKAVNATQKQVHIVKLHLQTKAHFEQEIQNYKNEATKQRKIISKLEKDRDRYINEATELTQRVLQNMNDITFREMQIFDFKKQFIEAETRLKQQQSLYEAVRADRNLYSKNLIEAQDAMSEMKRKLKIMHHQIDQLKEEITTREAALTRTNLEQARLEKEKEAANVELQRKKQHTAESKRQLELLEKEVCKLQQVIRETDIERKRQIKELDQVIGERDVLGSQLVRRNDELALLYEKVKIQQSTLNKGEVQYRQRLDDIRILKLEIKKLRREKATLKKTAVNVEDLKRLAHHTQRELMQEKTLCKALQEEIENPMNVHRWRKLEGSDPSAYELIKKVQALQKRLIQKTAEVVDKELLIQEKDRLYINLRHVLARRPGPEVSEQIRVYQETLRSKTKQMKRLASELNMYESQSSEYKFEIEKLAEELKRVKNKYFMQKKKERQIKEREKVMAQAGAPSIELKKVDRPKFAGGGFKRSSPQKTAGLKASLQRTTVVDVSQKDASFNPPQKAASAVSPQKAAS